MTARRPLMTRLALALLGTAAVAACTDQGPGGLTAAGSGFCRDTAALVDQAQRFNFETEFASAEAVWSRLAIIYDDPGRDPRAECGTMVPRYSEVLANQALVYSNQRKFVAADGMFRAAARQAAAEGNPADGTTLPAADARPGGEVSIVEILRTQHDLNRAIGTDADALVRAGDLAAALRGEVEATGFATDVTGILELSPQQQRRRVLASLSEFSRSFTFLQQERYAEAEEAIDQAIALIAPVPGAQSNYAPRYRTTKALLALGQNRPEDARALAASAAAGYSEDLAGTALRARALTFQARAESLLGLEDQALATYAEAFSIYQDTAVPISYDLAWPYFNLALRRAEADPARRDALTRAIFEAAQTLRSRTTATSLAIAARDRAEGTGEEAEAIRAWRAAQAEVQRVQAALNTTISSPLASDDQKTAARRQFSEAAADLADREEALSEVAGDYLGLLSARTDVDRIMAALAPDEALIQIIPGEPYSIAFALTNDGIRAARVGGNAELPLVRQLVYRLRDIMRAQGFYRPNDSHAIYEELVAPALALLDGQRPKRLIFALSDALTALPMEVLATAPSAIADNDRPRIDNYTDVQWLADAYEISYVPSPSALADLRAETDTAPAPGSRKVVAFGDFIPGVTAQDVLPAWLPQECAPEAQLIADFGPLPGSAPELEILRGIFGSRIDITSGAAFTEGAVTTASAAGVLAGADIVHFSTHGFLPQSDDCLNQGGLTVSLAGTGAEDGVLTESDIRGLNLSGTDLVVLTACDTAGATTTGTLLEGNVAEGGEALSGLARAFFDAGARAALVTHWPIIDGGPSLALVQGFYTALEGGQSYSGALKAAQAQVRASPATSDPYFWGAFVLVGDGAGGQ